jgi:DNA-binding phage protein
MCWQGSASAFLFMSFIFVDQAIAETTTSHSPETIALDADLIAFFKYVVYAGGVFVALLALIGVAFFGFDVRKARQAIQDELTDLRKIIENAKSLSNEIERNQMNQEKVQKELSDLKQTFEKTVLQAELTIGDLSTKFEDFVEQIQLYGGQAPSQGGPSSTAGGPASPQGGTASTMRSNEELVREVLRDSAFEWRSMSALIRKTGLTRDEILKTARAMPDIKIGIGKKSGDHIFGFKS